MRKSHSSPFAWRLVLLVAVSLAAASGGRVASQNASDPSVVGQWGPVMNWPVVAVHMHLLTNGKVMFNPKFATTYFYDPATNAVTAAPLPPHNTFCSGHSQLADGRILVTGGHVLDGWGLPDAAIFDPAANSWTALPIMNNGRWYPSSTVMANGEVLVTSGSMDVNYVPNPYPQVWTGAGWRELTTARLTTATYPRIILAPNGKAFYAGPEQRTRYLDTTGTGAWTILAERQFPHRSYGSAFPYEDGKIVYFGGGDPPTDTAEVIDLNAPAPAWRYTAGRMSVPRRQSNATVLPDGKVLITGGVSGAGFNNTQTRVLTAEMWDPVTEQFTPMASMQKPRWYHSNALLLPDGRVLSAGGDDNATAEIYSPPYLFRGGRPTLSSAPASVNYGQAFAAGTPDAAAINRVVLIRVGTSTHANGWDQRINRLTFTRGAGSLTVTAPADPRLCPPGPYMLFILNGSGVPSVARIVRVGGALQPPPPNPPAPAAPSNLVATAISATEVRLTWTDNAYNERGFRIEQSQSGGGYLHVGSAAANGAEFVCEGLSPGGAYSFRVRAFNAGGVSNWSNIASVGTGMIPGAPAAPTGLAARGIADGVIRLHWEDNAGNEDGFAVEQQVAEGGFNQISTLPPNSTGFDCTGLTRGSHYTFRVRAYNAGGPSPYSNEADAEASAPVALPAAPTNLTAKGISSTEVELKWVDNANNESGFAIYRSDDNVTWVDVDRLGPNVTTYTSHTRQPDSVSYYRVRAYNSAAFSDYSNVAMGRTLAEPPVPAPPTNLAAKVVSATKVQLDWADASNTETGFRVFKSTDGTNWTNVAKLGANITTYQSTVVTGKKYYFKVRAFNANGSSPDSSVVTATAGSSQPVPAAPTNLAAAAVSSSKIRLNWTDNATNETGFKIYRSTDNVRFTAVSTLGANVVTYTSSGRSPKTTYYYKVRAYNGAGNSAYSNTASATTPAG